MSNQIIVGQREIEYVEGVDLELLGEESAMLEQQGVKASELYDFVRENGKQTIIAAIGGVKTLQGRGEEVKHEEPKEVLALGQREVVDNILFTEEEVALMKASGVSPDELLEFVKNSSVQTINAAISGVATLKAGQGQERNKPFQTQEEADADASKLTGSDSSQT